LLYDRLKQLDLSETLDGIQIRLPNIQEGNDFPVSNHADKGLDNDHSNGNVGRNWHKKQTKRWSEPSSQTPSYGLVAMKRLSSNSASSIKNTKSEKPIGNPLHVGKSGQETDFDKLDDEWTRLSLVKRKKDFRFMENIKGRAINVLQGLELHTGIFNQTEQERIVNLVYSFQKLGREGRLRERTYSEPKKWLRGKGRVTIQFGCCYNYATDKNGNPPGIIRTEEVDPLPPLFIMMIKRMVRWHVLPPSCVPDSCIVNIYEADDCIPPHIDHHDFVRPFCTVSFLTECNILFGSNLKIIGPGEFSGPFSLPLPIGSVFILNGNGADVAKHCIPGVPAKRISITFRKMDSRKLPYEFKPHNELQGIRPMQQPDTPPHQPHPLPTNVVTPMNTGDDGIRNISLSENEFPELSSGRSIYKQRISATKWCIKQ